MTGISYPPCSNWVHVHGDGGCFDFRRNVGGSNLRQIFVVIDPPEMGFLRSADSLTYRNVPIVFQQVQDFTHIVRMRVNGFS